MFGVNRQPEVSHWLSEHKLHYCKIWDGDILIRDYVPVLRNSDGVAGLYDLVNNTFTPSATGTAFIAGPVLYMPEEYEALEYIESTGAQYINTEYYCNSDTSVELNFTNTRSGSTYFFGQRTSISEGSYFVTQQASGNLLNLEYGKAARSISDIASNTGNEILFYGKKNSWYANGSLVQTINTTAFTSKVPALLCNVNKSTTENGVTTSGTGIIGKIYFCKIWDNDKLVRDYVPVKNSNGVAGLYDMATGTFKPSASATAFVAGTAL